MSNSSTFVLPQVWDVGGEVAVHNEAPVYVIALGVLLAVWGSAWVWCKAMCGWNNVSSCKTRWWGTVEARCKS